MKNFEFKQKTRFESCACDVYEYEHTSGAKLVYMAADTEEKTFCAAFKTVPEDSTGVFHILEHSVLDGSKNFPMSSPFLYMLKNSMNTFLNAMTFQGKTMYPCASCNPDDFENLMNVYLDSVFNPLLSEDTFMREGWHVEKTDLGYDIKGVVYNEMQGATASLQRRLYSAMTGDLYPDTYQAFNSGGEPDDIPSLTYEGYLAAYRKYYSAKNCVLFLCGKMDLERYTDVIDRYLEDASKLASDIRYSVQAPHNSVCEHTYPIAPTDDEKGKTNIMYSYNVGHYGDAERMIAAQMIASYLMDSNSSPLKSALISSGLMQDADIYVSDDIQAAFGIAAYNTEKENRDSIEKVIKDTVSAIIKKGIDADAMLSKISAYAFKKKEKRNEVVGLGVWDFVTMVDNIFYEQPIDTYFELDAILAKLEGSVSCGYFEALMCEIFLKNDTTAVSVLVPVKTEPGAQHKKTVEKYLSPISSEEKDATFERFVELSKQSASKDTEENIAKMPSLSLDKLQSKLAPRAFAQRGRLLHTDSETNGVAYYRFYFSLAGLTAKECMTAKLVAASLSDFATADSSAEELSNRLNRYAGKWTFSPEVYSNADDEPQPYLIVSVSCLEKNAEKALEVIGEILTKTVYDETTAKNIINRELNAANIMFNNNGVGIAMNKAASFVSNAGAYENIFGGYEYVCALKGYADNAAAFCADAVSINARIFTESNLRYVGLTGKESLADIKLDLPAGEERDTATLTKDNGKVVAYSVPSGVSYNVRSVRCADVMEFGGKHRVMRNLMSLGYLWHQVREVGGAYGTGLVFKRNGQVSVYSYRDPKVKETYAVYDAIPEFLANNNMSDREVLGYIISTLSEFVNPKSISATGIENEIYCLTGYTFEERQKHLDEVISFTKDDIKRFIPIFERLNESRAICSVGNGGAQTESGLFEEIINV